MTPPKHTLEWSAEDLQNYFISTDLQQIASFKAAVLRQHCVDHNLFGGGTCADMAERLQENANAERRRALPPDSARYAEFVERREVADGTRQARRQARALKARLQSLTDAADDRQAEEHRAVANRRAAEREAAERRLAGEWRKPALDPRRYTDPATPVREPQTPPAVPPRAPLRPNHAARPCSEAWSDVGPLAPEGPTPEQVKKKFFLRLLQVPEELLDKEARRLIENAFEQAMLDSAQRRGEQPAASVAAAEDSASSCSSPPTPPARVYTVTQPRAAGDAPGPPRTYKVTQVVADC